MYSAGAIDHGAYCTWTSYAGQNRADIWTSVRRQILALVGDPYRFVLGLGAYLVAAVSDRSVLTAFDRFSLNDLVSTHWLDPLVVLAVAGILLSLLGIGGSAEPASGTDDRD